MEELERLIESLCRRYNISKEDLESEFLKFGIFQQEDRSQIRVFKSFLYIVETRDPFTKGHSERVARIALRIAGELNFSPDKMQEVEVASLLHDIGKIGIPDSILKSPNSLSQEEIKQVRKHPILSENLVKKAGFYWPVGPAIRGHHERWDGKGYPEGLKEEKTPLIARIIAVSDAYEAMTSDRPYRKALSKKEARIELELEAGFQFDKDLIDILLKRVLKEEKHAIVNF